MTTTTPTADELRARLADFEQEAADAERELGRASLDGASTSAATKKARAAREGIESTHAALEELTRREADRQSREREIAAARERAGVYRWASEYVAAATDAVATHEAAAAAIARLADLERSKPGRLRQIQSTTGAPWRPAMPLPEYQGRRFLARGESEIEADIVAVTSTGFARPKANEYKPFGVRRPLTVERCRELRELAERLAAEALAEAEGGGKAEE
jgi:hypothetical protein